MPEIEQPDTVVPIGAAEFVLGDGGIILDVQATGEGVRLVKDVSEGEGFEQYIHPEERDAFSLMRNWVIETGRNSMPLQLRWARSNGRWSAVNAIVAPLSNETTRIYLALDEAAYHKRAASQMRRVVEGSLQGIVVRTGKRLIYTNDAFAHLIGFTSARELMDQRGGLGPNGSIHPDDVAMVADRLRRRTAGDEEVSSYEFRLIHRDGSFRCVETLAARVDWDGEPVSVSWMTDVTARKEMERQLIESKTAAEYANRTKTDFLANMSHELRTPLNAIIGFSEVIKDEMFGPAGQTKYVEYAHDIHLSGQHLLDIINDILDLSKLEAGKLELRETMASLPELIDQCEILLRDRARAAGVRLLVEVQRDLPRLRCDQRAVKQVLINFLSNAVKCTSKGGAVTVRAEKSANGCLRLSVADTGIGMTAKEIAIALSPFGQIDSKLARQHQGTGLGLPICQSLIQLHGGTLSVESEPNVGTKMTAEFPVDRTAQSNAALLAVNK